MTVEELGELFALWREKKRAIVHRFEVGDEETRKWFSRLVADTPAGGIPMMRLLNPEVVINKTIIPGAVVGRNEAGEMLYCFVRVGGDKIVAVKLNPAAQAFIPKAHHGMNEPGAEAPRSE